MTLKQGNPEGVGMSSGRIGHLEDLAADWTAKGEKPPSVLLAARRGTIVTHRAYGNLRPGRDDTPLELDSIFPVASISKMFTATCAMILVEEGRLDLIAPVQEYIPEFQGKNKDRVLVWHLLTHTSGLRDQDIWRNYKARKRRTRIPPCDDTQHPAIHESLTLGYGGPLWKPPGEEMSYCSFNFQLIAEIVRRISRQSFETFVGDRVFTPLGMKDTFFVVPDEVTDRIIQYPEGSPFSNWFLKEEGLKTPWADGGAFSTAMDLAVFGQTYLNEGIYGDVRILSPVTVKYMAKNQIPGIHAYKGKEFFPEASWGIGWNVLGTKKDRGSLQSVDTFCHGGSGGTCFWIDPVYEIVGVSLTVGGTPQPSQFINAVSALIVDI